MEAAEEQETLMDLASKCMEEDNIVAMVAVLPKKTRSIVGFLSMNGFNTWLVVKLLKMQLQQLRLSSYINGCMPHKACWYLRKSS